MGTKVEKSSKVPLKPSCRSKKYIEMRIEDLFTHKQKIHENSNKMMGKRKTSSFLMLANNLWYGADGETRDDVSLVFDEPSFDHGHSPRTTAKLKAMAGQALEFNNQIYVSSSSSSASEDDDFGEPKRKFSSI